MTMMMCDLWSPIGLLCNCQISAQLFLKWKGLCLDRHAQGITGYNSLEGSDVRGRKQGLNDFLHPTCFKRTTNQHRDPKSDFNLAETEKLMMMSYGIRGLSLSFQHQPVGLESVSVYL